jgi:hypothetical protein
VAEHVANNREHLSRLHEQCLTAELTEKQLTHLDRAREMQHVHRMACALLHAHAAIVLGVDAIDELVHDGTETNAPTIHEEKLESLARVRSTFACQK